MSEYFALLNADGTLRNITTKAGKQAFQDAVERCGTVSDTTWRPIDTQALLADAFIVPERYRVLYDAWGGTPQTVAEEYLTLERAEQLADSFRRCGATATIVPQTVSRESLSPVAKLQGPHYAKQNGTPETASK